ncbi:MAG: M1 family metallopeptidase [Bacteroidota bacterium]
MCNRLLFILLLLAGLHPSLWSQKLGQSVIIPAFKKAKPLPAYTKWDSLRGFNGPMRNWFDVKHYDLHLRVDPYYKRVSGYNDISFEPRIQADSMQIDLHPALSVKAVVLDGDTLSYRRVRRAILMGMPEDLLPDRMHVLRVVYEGEPPVAKQPPWQGGFVWEETQDDAAWVGVACQFDGASVWWPLKDHPTDEPDSVDIHLEVPLGLKAISNGRLITNYPGINWEYFHWKISYPINLYNLTVYVGPYLHFSEPYPYNDSLGELDFYVLPHHEEQARKQFPKTVGILQFLEKRFGNWPWPRDGFKMVESPYYGMEHQTAIAYGNNFQDNEWGFDYIILHETAHEWWGNSLSAADMADLWLHEGFATYSEALYVEEKMGQEAYLNYLKKQYWGIIGNWERMIGQKGVHAHYSPDIYPKGAWILHSLRSVYANDSLFFDLLKNFATRYRQSLISTQTFINYVNQHSGKDFGPFFQQYLFNHNAPRLELKIEKEKGKKLLVYRWKNAIEGFDIPVRIQRTKGKEQSEFTLVPTPYWQRLEIKGGKYEAKMFDYYMGVKYFE